MSGLLTGIAFTKQFPEIDTTNGGGGSSSYQGTTSWGQFSHLFSASVSAEDGQSLSAVAFFLLVRPFKQQPMESHS
jgi:hypothetical protein